VAIPTEISMSKMQLTALLSPNSKVYRINHL